MCIRDRLYTAAGTALGHERGEGGWWTDGAWTADPADFDHPEQCTKASYDYFAAVPENCHSLTVKVYDFEMCIRDRLGGLPQDSRQGQHPHHHADRQGRDL